MKRSGPLILIVAGALATLSYGGKLAALPQFTAGPTRGNASRTPTSVFHPLISGSVSVQKPSEVLRSKNAQDPVVIAEFPPLEAASKPLLEIEEITPGN